MYKRLNNFSLTFITVIFLFFCNFSNVSASHQNVNLTCWTPDIVNNLSFEWSPPTTLYGATFYFMPENLLGSFTSLSGTFAGDTMTRNGEFLEVTRNISDTWHTVNVSFQAPESIDADGTLTLLVMAPVWENATRIYLPLCAPTPTPTPTASPTPTPVVWSYGLGLIYDDNYLGQGGWGMTQEGGGSGNAVCQPFLFRDNVNLEKVSVRMSKYLYDSDVKATFYKTSDIYTYTGSARASWTSNDILRVTTDDTTTLTFDMTSGYNSGGGGTLEQFIAGLSTSEDIGADTLEAVELCFSTTGAYGYNNPFIIYGIKNSSVLYPLLPRSLGYHYQYFDQTNDLHYFAFVVGLSEEFGEWIEGYYDDDNVWHEGGYSSSFELDPVSGLIGYTCNANTYYTEPMPSGVVELAVWYIKRFFWETFNPECFFSSTRFTNLKSAIASKAPFAYVSAVFNDDTSSVTEVTGLTISFPVLGTSFNWTSSAELNSNFLVIKTALTVLLWLGFSLYLKGLTDRVITK